MSIEVRLYGKLRRLAPGWRVGRDVSLQVETRPGQTIGQVLARLGLAPEEVSLIFLNGELSVPTRRVSDGDRLGLFPQDMGLLYSWYFEKKG